MELTLLQSMIFGLVQGVTEFLPISSSGHLVLVQHFFGISDPQVEFIVALHVGSLLAVVIYFWQDWMNLFRVKKDMEMYQRNPRLLGYVILATVPAVIFGFLFNDVAESLILSPVVIAGLIVVGSFILFVADRFFTVERSMDTIGTKDALVIGVAQVIALIPGVSRSGMTIAGARVCKLDRVSAARFSFLLATPIIAGAGLLQMKDLATGDLSMIMFVGVITSFLAAFVTIHYFLAFIQKVSYAIFLYYSIGVFIVVSIAFYVG